MIFKHHGCAECHAPPTYTSPDAYDVELEDEAGEHRFNPPSLRGCSQRGSFFHDNRAAQMRDIFVRFGHGVERELSRQEMNDLLVFLASL